MKEIIIGFVGGVFIPLIIIYLIERMGIISFGENYWLPAILIIVGGLILVLFSETSKFLYRVFGKIKEEKK